MKITSEQAKVLVDLCVAISFVAISAGKYLAMFIDQADVED